MDRPNWWSLFDFLCPGLLGSAAGFKKFVKGLEARTHDRYAPLRKLVDPYVLRRLKTICEEIASRQEKVLVFTQFREMTEPIAVFLADVFGQEGLVLHGGTAARR